MPNKKAATKKAAVRAIKLFILGVILQGYTYPYFVIFLTWNHLGHLFWLEFILVNFFLHVGGYIHGRHKLTYGVDLDQIRWLGVLQVIYKEYISV